ncbi:MAG: thermonuclease family protein [Lactobacillus sp.]|jgi:endonuclease YncB( thermonuclease family)|nr:thermonuclease family protein [Lactobacillus sp.]
MIKYVKRCTYILMSALLLMFVLYCVCYTINDKLNTDKHPLPSVETSEQRTVGAKSIIVGADNIDVSFDYDMMRGFDGIAVKNVSKSETKKSKSNKHEFHGVKSFELLLGSERREFNAKFYYLTDDGVVTDTAKVTWYYQTPPSAKGKKHYYLYYQNNEVVDLIEEKDRLLVGYKNNSDELSLIFAKKGTKHSEAFVKFINLDTAFDKNGEAKDITIDKVVLERSDFDFYINNITGERVYVGPVTEIWDGDSIVIAGFIEVRMLGLDAPETAQLCKDSQGNDYKCGEKAAENLRKLINKKKVSCAFKGKEYYKRHLFVCINSKGEDINKKMITDGWAVASMKEYREDEKLAKSKKLGIWQGEFDKPSKWRKDNNKKNKNKKT